MLPYFRCAGGRTIDPEKFMYSTENKQVDLENFRRNYKLGVGRQHRILSYTENKVLYSTRSEATNRVERGMNSSRLLLI